MRWAGSGQVTVLARRERPQALLRGTNLSATGNSQDKPQGGSVLGSVGVPEVICTSAQAQARGCPDGGRSVAKDCRSFTMCEAVALQ